MLKYLPLIIVGIVMVPLTVRQWKMMDWVWTDNIPAQQCAYLLETEIPYEIGDWVGKDVAVDAEVLDTAGADGYVNRVYTNQETDQKVVIWFIVGHFRDVSRHTPNICYKGAGFEQIEQASLHEIVTPGLPTSEFRTAKFHRQQGSQEAYERVFWAWWKPELLEEGESAEDVNIQWLSPEDPRLKFGFCRSLYKLYFTSGTDAEERPEESVCLEFAQEFLPIVHDKLSQSGVEMAKDELPADAEQVLKRMKDANEGAEHPTVTDGDKVDKAVSEEAGTEERPSEE